MSNIQMNLGLSVFSPDSDRIPQTLQDFLRWNANEDGDSAGLDGTDWNDAQYHLHETAPNEFFADWSGEYSSSNYQNALQLAEYLATTYEIDCAVHVWTEEEEDSIFFGPNAAFFRTGHRAEDVFRPLISLIDAVKTDNANVPNEVIAVLEQAAIYVERLTKRVFI